MAVAVAAQTLLVAALAATAVRAARWLRRALLLRRIPGPRGALVGGQMAHFSQRSDHHKRCSAGPPSLEESTASAWLTPRRAERLVFGQPAAGGHG